MSCRLRVGELRSDAAVASEGAAEMEDTSGDTLGGLSRWLIACGVEIEAWSGSVLGDPITATDRRLRRRASLKII